ncbi:flagellar biosynthetic protein FliO [Paenarthrobacter ureafaciens]|uniref:flagellar biosynthetic protein FliO n=1 Tax=Paenarthrobacter ureafaciens TaxID=37931 RepID=UPI001C2BB272|nr:flagellar biosynthetic protein FliO [Paenarthrobacter ureafaciens]
MDSFLLGLRVVVALGAVLAAIWLLQRRLGKGKGRRRADSTLSVVSRQAVGQKASVVVVDAGDKRFLLGVTEHNVTVLHSSDAPVLAAEVVDPVPRPMVEEQSFAQLFRQASGEQVPRTELVTGQVPVVRRRADLHRRAATPAHPLHGSILSASTWRQASDAFRGRRN